VATGSGRCHAGLRCFVWPLELGGQPLGRLVACGYRGAEEEWRAQLGALSAQLGLAEDALEATAACVPVLGVAEEERLRRVLARAAEALGEMARERLAYQERLEEIRRMTEMS
jgi:ligand-binding sensor protein